MKKPILIPVLNDDGTISHWALINPENGEKLWSENPEECAAQGYKVKSSPAPALTEEIDFEAIRKVIESGIRVGDEMARKERWGTYNRAGIIANDVRKHLSSLLSNSREGKDGEGEYSEEEKTKHCKVCNAILKEENADLPEISMCSACFTTKA